MLRHGLVIALAWLAVDHGSKWWMRERVMDPPRVIPVTDFFNLILGANTGVSFGMLGGADIAPWMLSALALAITLVLIIWLARTRRRLVVIGLGFVIGGALGNSLDRLRHGAVTDFLDFYLGAWHWPAFNMADVGISFGVALLILDSFLARPANASIDGPRS